MDDEDLYYLRRLSNRLIVRGNSDAEAAAWRMLSDPPTVSDPIEYVMDSDGVLSFIDEEWDDVVLHWW